MRKTLSAFAIALIGLSGAACADEGMWMPTQLPQIAAQMRARGFAGDVQALSDVRRAPLGAVVKVGGATGSFVSAQGLILTNHHVAFGVIQYNTNKGRDLIKDGFVAQNMRDELPANPDYRALVTVGFDRMTDAILAGARGKRGRAYFDAVDAASKRIVAECERDAGYRCSVASMDNGTDFYRIKQLELQDIRLVYAPPESIGSYGDEVDNFMWPRHSGDFTLLRAYVGKDGKPAPYRQDNVPFASPIHFQIATHPLAEGDFVMLAGYPGITYRHRMAQEFANQIDWQLPWRASVYQELLKAVAASAPIGSAAQVAYASQVESFKNTLKRAQGELEGLTRSAAAGERAADEAAMLNWLQSQRDAKSLLADIDAANALLAQSRSTQERDQLFIMLRSQTQLLRSALQLQRLAMERAKPDAQRESGYQQRDEGLIQAGLQQVQRRYDPAVEQALLAELLRRYHALPQDQRIPEVDAVFGGNDTAAMDALGALYSGTTLGVESERLRWYNADATQLRSSDDPLLKAAAVLLPAQLRMEQAEKARDGELLRLRPAYMRGLIAYRTSKGQAVYPDANATLRVSYGQLSRMRVRDGLEYAPLTSVRGIVEKHTGKDPFNAPQALRDAIAKADFGSTFDPSLNTQTVNLLTDLDTTGGNSGSPVFDGKGQLVGLNFDSNWEGVSASWKFDPRYKRAIHVDMRYMRWLMAKVYPAAWLLRELNLPEQ